MALASFQEPFSLWARALFYTHCLLQGTTLKIQQTRQRYAIIRKGAAAAMVLGVENPLKTASFSSDSHLISLLGIIPFSMKQTTFQDLLEICISPAAPCIYIVWPIGCAATCIINHNYVDCSILSHCISSISKRQVIVCCCLQMRILVQGIWKGF